MDFIKNLLQDETILENQQATLKQMQRAKAIIQKYATDRVPFDDILLRVAAFSNGMSIPNPNKPEDINIIPVLDDLARVGLVTKRPNGSYKRGDAVSRLIASVAGRKVDSALGGDLSRQGKLSFSQTAQMGHLGGSGEAGDKLERAPRNYKQGGRYSGATKEYIIKVTKERDPAWKALSDATKDMITRLQGLENPSYSFKVLKALLHLRAKKKGYIPFIEYVKENFKDQRYVDALYDLQTAGILDARTNTINNDAVKQVRNAIDFFEEEPVEGISPLEKVSAFLPNFMKAATGSSATTFRAINNIVTNKRFAPVINLINTKLTDDRLADIMATDDAELRRNQTLFIIKFLAKNLKANSVEELKSAIEEKKANRQDFKSDANKEAKSIGRMEEFLRIFDI